MILNRSYISKNKDIFYSVAIGNFDGIHLGHRFILNELKSCKKSNEDKIAVITFTPHPIKILKPSKQKKNLMLEAIIAIELLALAYAIYSSNQ